jgi:hypothetical protein
MLQTLIDKYYSAAYARIWAQCDGSPESVESALARCATAWQKAAERIHRETGYSV